MTEYLVALRRETDTPDYKGAIFGVSATAEVSDVLLAKLNSGTNKPWTKHVMPLSPEALADMDIAPGSFVLFTAAIPTDKANSENQRNIGNHFVREATALGARLLPPAIVQKVMSMMFLARDISKLDMSRTFIGLATSPDLYRWLLAERPDLADTMTFEFDETSNRAKAIACIRSASRLSEAEANALVGPGCLYFVLESREPIADWQRACDQLRAKVADKKHIFIFDAEVGARLLNL